MRRAGSVPRTVFWPVPNVDSGLVAFARRPGRPVPVPAARTVFAVIDAAFSQRRKTLRAALARWAGIAGDAERILRAAGVDPGARGEALDVAEFARIALAREDTAPPGDTPDPRWPGPPLATGPRDFVTPRLGHARPGGATPRTPAGHRAS